MAKSLFTAFFCITLLSSCALTPQQVNLSPDVNVNKTSLGNGQNIILTTVDERTTSTIGNRGIAGFGADITSDNDVVAIVRLEIIKGLEAQSFVISNELNNGPKELRVEIRNLEYKLTSGIFTGTLRTESALKGICLVNGKRSYEHLYRGGSEEQVLVAQFANENSAHINKALTEVIEDLLNDKSLFSCLAE
tara:strand:+ start:873 stop:1448 length:576 start_codon:yes stop_codon:yes gene_type:complete